MREMIPPIEPPGLRFNIRNLVRSAHKAALATTAAGEGRPYVSLVTVATDFDGSPLLLLSRLADHTRNIDADAQVALLFDGTDGYANPQQGPRVSVIGRALHCNEARIRQRFLARHPAAALYAGFADFAFYRLPLERVHWVGGFARAVWVDEGLTCGHDLSASFAEAEAELIEVGNATQGPLLDDLARTLLKRRGKGWTLTAVDPDGCDLTHGKTVCRLSFDSPLAGVGEFKGRLEALANGAKSHS